MGFREPTGQCFLPASGGTVYFKYDPFRRRIYKSSNSGTSIYAYDGNNLVEETNSSGAAVARYVQTRSIDEPLGMLRGGITSYYEADGVGSVTSLSSATGSVAQTYTYDSFGNLTSSTGTITNPFRYTGREFDAETSLYYYRARYYDISAGRFLSEDPIRYAGGSPNFYHYVFNGPLNLIDPTGLATVVNSTGMPIVVSGNPGMGHGTGGQVYGVVPPDGNLYGGPNNPVQGYPTVQAAIDAYNHIGPIQPAGLIYDIDFYSPKPLSGCPKPDKKIIGDELGPHYTLSRDKNGNVVDSYPWYQWFPAAGRRLADDANDLVDQYAPWLRYVPLGRSW